MKLVSERRIMQKERKLVSWRAPFGINHGLQPERASSNSLWHSATPCEPLATARLRCPTARGVFSGSVWCGRLPVDSGSGSATLAESRAYSSPCKQGHYQDWKRPVSAQELIVWNNFQQVFTIFLNVLCEIRGFAIKPTKNRLPCFRKKIFR